MLESLASCFGFLCSASLNTTRCPQLRIHVRLARIQYQRPLGLGVGLDVRFVVCCSAVSVLPLSDVRLDSRWVVLAVSVALSPVASTVSLVFLATVSPVSLVFPPTV